MVQLKDYAVLMITPTHLKNIQKPHAVFVWYYAKDIIYSAICAISVTVSFDERVMTLFKQMQLEI